MIINQYQVTQQVFICDYSLVFSPPLPSSPETRASMQGIFMPTSISTTIPSLYVHRSNIETTEYKWYLKPTSKKIIEPVVGEEIQCPFPQGAPSLMVLC
jgi:hypothetical protein